MALNNFPELQKVRLENQAAPVLANIGNFPPNQPVTEQTPNFSNTISEAYKYLKRIQSPPLYSTFFTNSSINGGVMIAAPGVGKRIFLKNISIEANMLTVATEIYFSIQQTDDSNNFIRRRLTTEAQIFSIENPINLLLPENVGISRAVTSNQTITGGIGISLIYSIEDI